MTKLLSWIEIKNTPLSSIRRTFFTSTRNPVYSVRFGLPKEFIMKRLLLIVLPLLLIIGCSKPIEDSTLIKKDGLMYHPDSKELYSGKVISKYIGGKKKIEGSYKDGKKDGLFIQWYENGKKISEVNFNNGIKGLINYFSIEGDTILSNNNKSMEIVIRDYKLFLMGEWSSDNNNSVGLNPREKKKEILFKFGEDSVKISIDGSIEDTDVIDYDSLKINDESESVDFSLDIFDFDKINFNLLIRNDSIKIRMLRIN